MATSQKLVISPSVRYSVTSILDLPGDTSLVRIGSLSIVPLIRETVPDVPKEEPDESVTSKIKLSNAFCPCLTCISWLLRLENCKPLKSATPD